MCVSMENFCCCISLEVGAQVISIISTLMSAIIMVLYSTAALLLKMSQLRMMFYATMGLTSGLQCLFGLLLCYGAFQRRPGLMWPWLVLAWCSGFSLLVASATGCVALILGGYITADAHQVISAYIVYSLFLLYCAWTVNSRRAELVKESKELELTRTLMRYPTAFKYA